MAFPLLYSWFLATGDDEGSSPGAARSRTSHDVSLPEELPRGTDRLLGIDNAAIVVGVRAGDDALFTKLVEAYLAPLAEWAYLLTNDGSLAEDVTAEVLSYVWEHRARWKVRESVEAYLFGAIRSRVYAVRRVNHRRAQLLSRSNAPHESPGLAEAVPLPDSATVAEDRRARVRAAVHALPERQREAVLARWYRGLSFDDVGQVLGISALAARQLVFRALATLRTKLEE